MKFLLGLMLLVKIFDVLFILVVIVVVLQLFLRFNIDFFLIILGLFKRYLNQKERKKEREKYYLREMGEGQ